MNIQRRIQGFEIGAASPMVALAQGLRQMGVRRIFGAPGGRCGHELIAAAQAQGIRFVPTRHESAAVIAAGVTGDLTGIPGVALVRQGPGLTNALAGLASMALDRSPALLICDSADLTRRGASHGQSMEPMGIVSALLKAHLSLLDDDAPATLTKLAAAAMAAPRGPVLLDVSRAVEDLPPSWQHAAGAAKIAPVAQSWIDELAQRLARARFPAIVLGMESRCKETAGAVTRLAEALGCPVFVTYKAKGVVPDEHRSNAGIFTGGVAETPLLSRCDLMVLVGMDPVEVPADSWRYDCTVIEIAASGRSDSLPDPLTAPNFAPVLNALADSAKPSEWDAAAIARHRDALRAALAYPGRRDSVGPQRVIEMARAATAARGMAARIAVDAGAHMISATTFWSCAEPNDLLISHGPAASSFAIPAAIAAWLHEPGRLIVAFVDEGGLANYLAELATAVAVGARIVVIVFNNVAISPMRARAGAREPATALPASTHIDFARVMGGFGGRGVSVRTVDEYAAALDDALGGEGPALIDVQIDPAGYERQWRALQG